MIINEKTKIKYTIETELGEKFEVILEGSRPDFYEQIKNNCEDGKIKIIKREIIEED